MLQAILPASYFHFYLSSPPDSPSVYEILCEVKLLWKN